MALATSDWPGIAEPVRAADAAVGASKVERFATAELLR